MDGWINNRNRLQTLLSFKTLFFCQNPVYQVEMEEPSAQTTEAELEEGLIHKLFMVKQPETGGI